MTNKEKIIEILKTINDPELFIDVYKLGLIYNVNIENEKVDITMTLTTPMCPFGPQLIEQIKTQVGSLEGVKEVNIDLVFEPAWQPSEEIKMELGIE